jgi:hypothetical protein
MEHLHLEAALAQAGVIQPRAEGAKQWQWEAAPQDGFHVLRHTFASIVLEAGESVVTVARWPGHSSPAITLGYYAHFMPEAGSKGRAAVDGLPGRTGSSMPSRTPQSLPTADPGRPVPEAVSEAVVESKAEGADWLRKC